MGIDLLPWLSAQDLQPILSALGSEALLAGLFFVATAALIALCVPGVLLPIAMSSGALLGTWEAAAVVTLGAVAGSQLFFVAARHLFDERLRSRLGNRLERFEGRFAAHGLWYVIGLRLVGTPHFLVTASSALMPIRSSSFAVATLIGFLPAILAAAATGYAI